MLRLFFRFRRSLLSSLCLGAVKALLKYLKFVTERELMPGVVAVIQTFGDRINFPPHSCAHLAMAAEQRSEETSVLEVERRAGVKLPGLLNFLDNRKREERKNG